MINKGCCFMVKKVNGSAQCNNITGSLKMRYLTLYKSQLLTASLVHFTSQAETSLLGYKSMQLLERMDIVHRYVVFLDYWLANVPIGSPGKVN